MASETDKPTIVPRIDGVRRLGLAGLDWIDLGTLANNELSCDDGKKVRRSLSCPPTEVETSDWEKFAASQRKAMVVNDDEEPAASPDWEKLAASRMKPTPRIPDAPPLPAKPISFQIRQLEKLLKGELNPSCLPFDEGDVKFRIETLKESLKTEAEPSKQYKQPNEWVLKRVQDKQPNKWQEFPKLLKRLKRKSFLP